MSSIVLASRSGEDLAVLFADTRRMMLAWLRERTIAPAMGNTQTSMNVLFVALTQIFGSASSVVTLDVGDTMLPTRSYTTSSLSIALPWT